MDNPPQFKIHGAERKKLKKELSILKWVVSQFWFDHQVEKDLASVYGGTDTWPMSDEQAEKRLNEIKEEIEQLEVDLAVPYTI